MLVKKETLKESGWMMKKNNSGEPEILAGIVTCNPEITLLSKNIRALEDQVSEIIIIDNDSENRDQIIALANSFDSIHVLLKCCVLGAIDEFLYLKQTQWVLNFFFYVFFMILLYFYISIKQSMYSFQTA